MRIIWSPTALYDLQRHTRQIAAHDQPAANKLVQLIVHIVDDLLPTTPHMGRPGRVQDTREFKLTGLPMFIVYQTTDTSIEILAIEHERQERHQ